MMNWLKKGNTIQTLLIQLKKADYDTKIKEIVDKICNHDKCITTQEFNKLKADNFDAKLKQAILTIKDDIPDFLKWYILMEN